MNAETMWATIAVPAPSAAHPTSPSASTSTPATSSVSSSGDSSAEGRQLIENQKIGAWRGNRTHMRKNLAEFKFKNRAQKNKTSHPVRSVNSILNTYGMDELCSSRATERHAESGLSASRMAPEVDVDGFAGMVFIRALVQHNVFPRM